MKRNNRSKARQRQARPAQSVLRRTQTTQESSWRDVFSRGQWYGVIILAIVIAGAIAVGPQVDDKVFGGFFMRRFAPRTTIQVQKLYTSPQYKMPQERFNVVNGRYTY